jgi:transcription antitermination factor NusG
LEQEGTALCGTASARGTGTGANWYALHVRSRHEFAAFSELHRKGIESFLPSVTRVSQWKDRKKSVEFPLFPGYLFVHIVPHPEEFLRVVKTRGSVKFVSLLPGHPTPILHEEIDSLKLLVESGETLDVYPYLAPGTRVKVKRGPLAGAEGVLHQRENQHLFLVNIEILGRSVGLRIYAEDIEQA